MFIYHIVTAEVWERFAASDHYFSPSLDTEGFIHCSYAEQVDGVIERYYGQENSVLILTIDCSLLSSRLVSEPSTAGELYPHIYGMVNKSAIVSIEVRNV
jgi:uncharacterized protein (DUF952 family)